MDSVERERRKRLGQKKDEHSLSRILIYFFSITSSEKITAHIVIVIAQYFFSRLGRKAGKKLQKEKKVQRRSKGGGRKSCGVAFSRKKCLVSKEGVAVLERDIYTQIQKIYSCEMQRKLWRGKDWERKFIVSVFCMVYAIRHVICYHTKCLKKAVFITFVPSPPVMYLKSVSSRVVGFPKEKIKSG